DINLVADGEDTGVERLANVVLVAVLGLHVAQEARLRAAGPQVAALWLLEALLVSEAELHRAHTILLDRLDLRDDAGANFEDGDWHRLPTLGEDLGHPQLPPDQSLDHALPVPFPIGSRRVVGRQSSVVSSDPREHEYPAARRGKARNRSRLLTTDDR